MRLLRRLLKFFIITLLILFAAALAIPVLFKKQITALVKKEINKGLTAKVDFSDLQLSIFRRFPTVSIRLEDLVVTGTKEFERDTLISSNYVDASVNLVSVIKGKNLKISGIYLESPRIHALVNKDGKVNWDITKPSTDTSASADTSASEFSMALKKYEIRNGYIYYRDEISNMVAVISGLNHSGRGNFTQDVFTLSTKTKMDAANFMYEAVPWLADTKTTINADIAIDTRTGKYSFKTDEIFLNNLKLNSEGFFQLVNDSTYEMDIKFNTPSNDFKDILSLVPGIYRKDFESIKTGGRAAINGFVKGTYSNDQMPAYDVNLGIDSAFFQYPDLPSPVKNIQVAMKLSNADGKPDNAVVDISKAHLEMDNEPFDFKFFFRNPETSKYIDAMAKGNLDLANVSRFVKLGDNTKLTGRVAADAYAKGSMAALNVQQDSFRAGGYFDISNLFYSTPTLPQPIKNGNIKLNIANQGGIADNTIINIPGGHIEFGNDPLDFTVKLSKPISAAEFNATAKGRFMLGIIKDFVKLDPGTSITGELSPDIQVTGSKAAIQNMEFDKVYIAGTAGVKDLKYISPDYPTGINIARSTIAFDPKTVNLKELSGNYLKTNFNANGTINNLVGYALINQPLKGTINVSADQMDLNTWMGTSADTSAATSDGTSSAFVVPSDLDLVINARAEKVKYDKVDYKNIAGKLVLRNETVTLENVKTEALDGTIVFNGSYSTRESKQEPAINMSYDVKGLDVQKTFFAFNTVQKLMPIGQFISGKLNSQLSMAGQLKENMMPDLASLTGKGNFLLVEGLLKKFAPLEKIASTLQIDELKSVTVKDIKNYIEFAKGQVLVKPFNLKVKDIDMQIGGLHGLDQTIDYAIQMKLPRKYLGTQGNSLVNDLAAKAGSKGIPIKLGEIVNLNIKLGGSITNPSIKTELKEVAGDAIKDLQQQALEFAKAKADTVRQTLRDTLKSVKNEVLADLKDEAKNKLFGTDTSGKSTIDDTKKKAGQTLKNTVSGFFKKKKPASDSTSK